MLLTFTVQISFHVRSVDTVDLHAVRPRATTGRLAERHGDWTCAVCLAAGRRGRTAMRHGRHNPVQHHEGSGGGVRRRRAGRSVATAAVVIRRVAGAVARAAIVVGRLVEAAVSKSLSR